MELMIMNNEQRYLKQVIPTMIRTTVIFTPITYPDPRVYIGDVHKCVAIC